jgi:integrase
VRLTEQTIRKLPPPEKGNRITYDDEIKGLGLRVTAGGVRAFVLNYRTNGRERRLTVGAYPAWSATAARERAKELRRAIDKGEDPLAEKQALRADPTFGDLAREYLRVEARPKQKRAKEYERILERDVLPQWRNIRAADIKRRDVIALVEKKAETAPVAANRTLELVRRVFNWALRRDIIEASPCVLVQRPRQEHSKDRVLSRDEIKALWESLDGRWFTQHCAAALRLILLTAQRPGEIAAMSWAEVDLASGWWSIPSEKAKNKLAHRVALNKTAREILSALPRTSEWVFPSPDLSQHVHNNSFSMALRRARLRPSEPLTVADFAPHDLRRSAASHMASAGVQRFIIGQVLNHKEAGVTKIYDRHGYDAEKRQASDKWNMVLQGYLEGVFRPALVVSIDGAR